jgi:prepilin peptidase CpaA
VSKEVNNILVKMFLLVILLLVAVIMDFASFKIKNRLILFGIIIGVLLRIYDLEWTSILDGFIGMVVPVIILLPFFLFKVLGAGDIKLFSVIGLFYGTTFVLNSMLYSLFIAGFISIIFLFKSKQFQARYEYFILYMKTSYGKVTNKEGNIKTFSPYYDVSRDGYRGVIHYSMAIIVAVIIQFISKYTNI